MNLSVAHYKAGRMAESIDAATKALAIEPRNSIAYNNICSAHIRRGEFDLGIAACEQALELEPEFAFQPQRRFDGDKGVWALDVDINDERQVAFEGFVGHGC